MPELPEAESIARQLHAALAGCRLGRVLHARADMVHGDLRPIQKALPGLRVRRAYRRAKRVILELCRGRSKSPVAELVFALGMTGGLRVCPARETVEKHTHLRLALAGERRELRFRDPRRFGGVWVLSIGECSRPKSGSIETSANGRRTKKAPATLIRAATAREWGPTATRKMARSRDRGLGVLGPEPLDLTAGEFRQVLSRRRQIKALLMDQSAVAGLGNIYCDESLHAAGIHPLTIAHSLDEFEARGLLRAIQRTLRRAIRFNGSTFMDYRTPDGAEGSFQRLHRVYNREGQPCKTCKSSIQRIQVAGRSTFFCPACQPERRPPAGK